MTGTFTAGITFSGGITFSVAPPPSGNTAGWFAGGASAPGQTSTVQRITFATDTATATARGPLSIGTRVVASTSGIQ